RTQLRLSPDGAMVRVRGIYVSVVGWGAALRRSDRSRGQQERRNGPGPASDSLQGRFVLGAGVERRHDDLVVSGLAVEKRCDPLLPEYNRLSTKAKSLAPECPTVASLPRSCPECRAKLDLRRADRDGQMRCPDCGARISIDDDDSDDGIQSNRGGARPAARH